MKGKILDYSIQESKGLISGDDGNRYEFVNNEWKEDKAPAKNQIVDFETDGNKAIGIYLVSSQAFNTDNMKEKMSQIGNSDTLKNAQSNITETYKAGIQNKFGFFVSIILAFALFLPVIQIPFLGSASLIDGGWGKFSLLVVIAIAILFYSGMKHLFVKVATGIFAFIIFIQFYDLFSSLYDGGQMLNAFSRKKDVNLFGLLEFGTFVIIPATLILLFASFKKTYTEKVSINNN